MSDHFPEGTFRNTPSNPSVTFLWDGPPQDIPSSIFIPVQDKPALASMNANRQRLPNYLAALAALLAGVLWVDEYHLAAGAFSLAQQDLREGIPTRISDTASQPAILEHVRHAQAFRSDDAVSVDQRTSDLVMKIAANISDLIVERCYSPLNLLPSSASRLAPGNCPLASAQFRKRTLKDFAVTKAFSIGCCDERFQPNVDTDLAFLVVNDDARGFNRKTREPLAPLADNAELPNRRSRQFAMPSNPHCSNMLESQFSTDNPPSTALSRIRKAERIKLVASLESRIARGTASLASSEERPKRFVQPTERFNCRSSVQLRPVRVQPPLNCQPSRLLAEIPIDASRLPAEHPAIKSSVIDSAVRLQSPLKFTLLIGVGEQAKLERLDHGLIIANQSRGVRG